MTFCPKCGKELPPNAEYCPYCGAKVSSEGVSYRKTETGWGIMQILAVCFGGMLLLTSFGLIFGGGFLIFGMESISQPDGYFMSRSVQFNVNSYAILQSGIDIRMDGMPVWRPMMQDILTIKITANNNNPSKEVFIGITSTSDADSYLNTIEYSTLMQQPWVFDRWSQDKLPTFSLHPGIAPSQPPVNMNIWVASTIGSGTQSLTWVPQTGDYSVVIMNSDGTKNVDVSVQLGAKIPILRGIGVGLLVGGVILGFIGALIVYNYFIRKR
jgi:hypothetical protein